MSRPPGPPPKSRELKLLDGNPGHQAVEAPTAPAAPPAEQLKPPPWLNRYGKQEFKRLAPILEPMGLLTAADVPLFSMLCSLYGEMIEARRHIKKHGTVMVLYKDVDGAAVPVKAQANPSVAVARNAAQQVRLIASEFGLSPSMRGRISLPAAADDDADEDLD